METLQAVIELMKTMGLEEYAENMDVNKGVQISRAVQKAVFDNLNN